MEKARAYYPTLEALIPVKSQCAVVIGYRVDVQHERISVLARLGHDEGNTLSHEAANEGDVT